MVAKLGTGRAFHGWVLCALMAVVCVGAGIAAVGGQTDPAAEASPGQDGLAGAVVQVEQGGTTRRYVLASLPATAPASAPQPASQPTSGPLAEPGLRVSLWGHWAPCVVHVQATGLGVQAAALRGGSVEWDFGDPEGRFNQLPGFNAAHIYDRAGEYVIRLRVIAPDGYVQQRAQTIRVLPDARRRIHLATNGDDANDGQGADRAVRTLGRAARLLGDDCALLLRRGDVFEIGSSGGLSLAYNNVLVGSYGDASQPKPLLRYTGPLNVSSVGFFTLNAAASANITIQDLVFDSIYPAVNGVADYIPPVAVRGGATNLAVRNCTILNMGGGVTFQNGRGLLLQDNAAPLETGLRSYFLWFESSDGVVLGNTVANSTRESVLRTGNNFGPGGFERLLVAHNDLTNLDRTGSGDASDIRKVTLSIMAGQYVWMEQNTLSKGVVRFGPITVSDTSRNEERTRYVVFRQNLVSFPDEVSSISNAVGINHGTEQVRIEGNTILNGFFRVQKFDQTYQRGVVDLVFQNNLVQTQGTAGRLIYFEGDSGTVAQQVKVLNNVLVAPNLVRGAGESGGIYAQSTSLAFGAFSGNVYSLPDIPWYTATAACSAGRGLSRDEWLAREQVSGDRFEQVTLPVGQQHVTIGGVTAGCSVSP